jgi:hypothetical protein
MMNEPVKKPQFGVELPAVRRFALADIAQHAKWILPRLVKTYPHLNDRTALGFLNNVLYNAEFYFCYQPHAVGIEENSDVPHDKIRPLFDKRIFTREQKFVRIG